MGKSNMYKNVKTYNPAVGCNFECFYCKPSFQQQIKRVSGIIDCKRCYTFKPHEHPERLDKIPSADTVFMFGTGDISFYRQKYVKQVINSVHEDLKKHEDRLFYFQSKNPACFQQYLANFPKDNTVLLTTLETNRDAGYERISKAPVPSRRYADFKALDWCRKIVTIEPIMEFDHDVFLRWIVDLKPEAVWIGYNSREKQVKLPEPSLEKTNKFIAELRRKGIEVREKAIR